MTSVAKAGRTSPSWMTRFWAVVRYELLWNIRKKKFLAVVIVAFALVTLSLALPVILSSTIGESVGANPDYVVTSSIGSFGFFLFALVTAMNSISGEFESGTIVPLLTKPVSRTMVFLGKLFAAFTIILVTYTILFAYTVLGGTVVYGAQNNLHLVPLTLLGSILSTFVWIAIVLAVASLSKSSMIAAIGGLGIFLALLISAPIVSAFSSQAWVLTYVPGSGASGTLGAAGPINVTTAESVATGTDGIGANLATFVLHSNANVTFYRLGIIGPGPPTIVPLYTEPLSLVLARSIAVAFVYVAVFLLVAWFFFRRAQVLE